MIICRRASFVNKEGAAMRLLEAIQEHQVFPRLLEAFGEGGADCAVHGVGGAQRAYLISALWDRVRVPCLVVVSDIQRASSLCGDLRFFLPGAPVEHFAPAEVMPYEVVAASAETTAQRLKVLDILARRVAAVVVASVQSLLTTLVPAEIFAGLVTRVRLGQQVNLGGMVERLVALGYDRVDLVEGKGQFSVRGGIVDVFSLVAESPVRLEFAADTVESIRSFDPADQRSVGSLKEVSLVPAREVVLAPGALARGTGAIKRELDATVARMTDVEARDRLARRVQAFLEKLGAGILPESVAQYRSFFYPEQATLFNYLPANAVIFFDEPVRLTDEATETEKLWREVFSAALATGNALPSQARAYPSFAELVRRSAHLRRVYLSLLPRHATFAGPAVSLGLAGKPMQSFHGKFALFQEAVARWLDRDYTVLAVCGTEQRTQRVWQLLFEAGVEAAMAGEGADLRPGCVWVGTGSLSEGFEFDAIRFAVVTDAELFGQHRRKRSAGSPRQGVRAPALRDLRVGDYVVHINHGVARYLGVKTLEVEGVHRDYLFLRYAGADRLYVPTDQMRLIQKYVGVEGHEPKISRLGGTEWSRAKNRVRESIRDMAQQLLAVQAARQALPGFAFSPDTVWQAEFEDAFPYRETADQLQAITDVKADMVSPRAMDRLVCGDVGYGKTEVAMRAAFRTVMDGKQVAVLVPTTVLAQQHYLTFTERFSGYPMTIHVLSRFRSQREQERTLKALRSGTVDIVVGTHRLLQEDVKFADLGLLVIDEEQRFGVTHKEKLKQMRKNVDVLTLTATPIPRTLHMSLAGLRDTSVMETPPEDRLPVQTYVVEYADTLVRDAVMRELRRGGQVYYVHNRVQTIEAAAARVAAVVPEARIAVAHGRQREDQLERIMLDFVEGRYDVLVCTTIVEIGLDIANVNTLIVDEADEFGLAQLYQLRGRVGRSNRPAYAYFTYRPDRLLSEAAEKRLQTIREFTEFGSGFKIALRDLEIRGAGNLLGPEQHGFILSVGFDLYCQLLEEAVRSLKGEKVRELPEPTVDLKADAYLPDEYIPDPRQKIEAYRRISLARSVEELRELAAEFADRYGPLPPPGANLLAIAELRILGACAGVASISQDRQRVALRFPKGWRFPADAAARAARTFGSRVLVGAGRCPFIELRWQGMPEQELLAAVRTIVEGLAGATGGSGRFDPPSSENHQARAGRNE